MPNDALALVANNYSETLDADADAFRTAVEAHVRPILDKHQTALAALRADYEGGLHLSQYHQKLDALRANAEETATKWHEEIDAGLAEEIVSREAALAAEAAVDLPEPNETELRMLEAGLQGLDATQRMSAYASADERKRRAMEILAERAGKVLVARKNGDVGWEPLLDPEQIGTFQQGRLEAAHPAAVRELRRLRQLRAAYRGVMGTVRATIHGREG